MRFKLCSRRNLLCLERGVVVCSQLGLCNRFVVPCLCPKPGFLLNPSTFHSLTVCVCSPVSTCQTRSLAWSIPSSLLHKHGYRMECNSRLLARVFPSNLANALMSELRIVSFYRIRGVAQAETCHAFAPTSIGRLG